MHGLLQNARPGRSPCLGKPWRSWAVAQANPKSGVLRCVGAYRTTLIQRDQVGGLMKPEGFPLWADVHTEFRFTVPGRL